MSEATRDLASTERYLPIIRRVRRRGLIIIAVSAVVVLIVAVRGATLYAALLPGEMPVRWVDDSSGFRWSSNAPIRWVSAEPSTIFGPLAQGIVFLIIAAVLVHTGVLGAIWTRFRRFLFGFTGPTRAALETCFFDYLTAWLSAGLAVAMALDGWEMWSLALGNQAPVVHMLVTASSPFMLMGFGLSLLLAWREVKAAFAKEAGDTLPPSPQAPHTQ